MTESYFIIRGKQNVTEMVEINGKMHALAENKLWKMRDVMITNAIKIVQNEKEEKGIQNISKQFELVEFDSYDVIKHLDDSTLNQINYNHIPGLPDDFAKKNHLIQVDDKLIKLSVKELKSLTEYKLAILETKNGEKVEKEDLCNIRTGFKDVETVTDFINSGLQINNSTHLLLAVLIFTTEMNQEMAYEEFKEKCSESVETNALIDAIYTFNHITKEQRKQIVAHLQQITK